MTHFVKNDQPETVSKRYLEVGAGTGAFTKAIIQKMGPNDFLDVIEINEKFCTFLKGKYSKGNNVQIHCCSFFDWQSAEKYDVVVCSLPFNAFPVKMVHEAFAHLSTLIKEEGILSYCEYLALPGIKKAFVSANTRKKIEETLEARNQFEKKYQFQLDTVFVNFPPSYVHHCRVS